MRRSEICLYLGPADHVELQALLSNRNTSRKLARRAGIVLATADGAGIREIGAGVDPDRPNEMALVFWNSSVVDAIERREMGPQDYADLENRMLALPDSTSGGTNFQAAFAKAGTFFAGTPDSPDLNPMEMAFSKLKVVIRKAAAGTYDELWQAVGQVCDLSSDEECYNFFRAAGYEAN